MTDNEMNLIRYEYKRISSSLTYLTFEGNFCYPYVFRIKEELYKLLSENQNCLLVDLNNLDYIDSVGIGIIIGLQLKTKELNGQFYLICRKGKILKIIELVGLDNAFKIFSELEEAEKELLKQVP